MIYSYGEMYTVVKDMEVIARKRLDMIHYVNEYGFHKASKYFKTDRKTIKKWYRRYLSEGIKGLHDRSRKPITSPKTIDRKTVEVITKTVIEAKAKNKYITVKNVRKKSKVKNYSDTTINRYIKKALNNKPKAQKRNKTTGGSVAFKEGLLPFEIIQVDIKYLTDIDNLKPYFNDDNSKSLMKYQITARDVLTGYPLVSYCMEKSSNYTRIFLEKVLVPFLKQFKYLDFKTIRIQTDNGKEFTNKYTKTENGHEAKETLFTIYINDKFKDHKTNIPGHCTQNSDVETFHWDIERDCLAWEDIVDNKTLIKYVTEYINVYVHTKNGHKGYSPYNKIKETLHVRSFKVSKPLLLSIKESNNILS